MFLWVPFGSQKKWKQNNTFVDKLNTLFNLQIDAKKYGLHQNDKNKLFLGL